MWTRAAVTAAVGGVLFLVAAPASAGESLEAIEKALNEKWKDLTAVSAKVKISNTMMQGNSTSEGTVEYLVKDGKPLMRTESMMEHSMGGQTLKMSSLMISDGEYTYVLSEAMGQKTAMKSKARAADNSMFGADMMTSLKKDNEVSAGDDAKADGKDCYVVNAKPKSGQSPEIAVMKFYFDKGSGIIVRVESLSAKGEAMMTVAYSDVKVNPKLDPERFKFVAPEGVQVMDMPGQ